jgi:outer membrane protein
MPRISLSGKLFKAILFTFVFVACFPGNTPAAEKQVFNLDQLVAMALESSPELRMADQDVLSAKSDVKQADAGKLPQLDLRGVTGPVDEAKVPTADKFGQLVSHDSDTITIFGRLDFVISQPLYTFGKISNRKQAAAFGVEAQLAAREQKRNEVILNVKELYYAYLVAAQGKSAAKEADDFIQDAAKRIKRLIELKAKNADQSDLYRLEAYSAEVKSFQAKAESGAHVAYAALKRAAGIPDNTDFRLDITELPKKPVPLAAEDEYVQMALSQRPELTRVKKGADAQMKLAEAAKSDLYPSLFAAAVGSVAGAPGRQKFDNSYISDDFNHAYAGVVAGAEWHFDLGIGQGKLDKARAEHRKTLAAQDYATQNIPLEVIKYYQDALESQTGYKSYEQAAIGSRRWIISSFTNFDVGVGTAKDMFDAIDRYGKNQGEYLRSLYTYHVSLARLNYAIGQKEEIH